MRKRIVIRNGKKYIVNTPDDGDCGWEDGIGPGGPAGKLWLLNSTDGLWYEVSLTGTSASAIIYVNQTPLNWASNDLGYQYLCYGGGSYILSVSGSTNQVTASLAAGPLTSSDCKPNIWLQSISDGYIYSVSATGSTKPFVDQNSKRMLYPPPV
jgi:hypothetical protein